MHDAALFVYGAVFGLGLIVGLVIGGILADLRDWRWVFSSACWCCWAVAHSSLQTVAPDASASSEPCSAPSGWLPLRPRRWSRSSSPSAEAPAAPDSAEPVQGPQPYGFLPDDIGADDVGAGDRTDGDVPCHHPLPAASTAVSAL